MRVNLLQNSLRKKGPLVVSFPPGTPDFRKRKDSREIEADCGHVVLLCKLQRDLAKKLPTCCVTCAFAAGVDVSQVQGIDGIAFRMTRKMKEGLIEAQTK